MVSRLEIGRSVDVAPRGRRSQSAEEDEELSPSRPAGAAEEADTLGGCDSDRLLDLSHQLLQVEDVRTLHEHLS